MSVSLSTFSRSVVCNQADALCIHCSKEMKVPLLEKHEAEECPMRLVECPLGCGTSGSSIGSTGRIYKLRAKDVGHHQKAAHTWVAAAAQS